MSWINSRRVECIHHATCWFDEIECWIHGLLLVLSATSLGSSGRSTPTGGSGASSARSRFAGATSKTSSFLASLNPARWGRSLNSGGSGLTDRPFHKVIVTASTREAICCLACQNVHYCCCKESSSCPLSLQFIKIFSFSLTFAYISQIICSLQIFDWNLSSPS